MMGKGKIDAPAFTEFEVDDADPAIISQQTVGGQIYVKNGKMVWEPLAGQPIDILAQVNDALATSKDFDTFKKKLATKIN